MRNFYISSIITILAINISINFINTANLNANIAKKKVDKLIKALRSYKQSNKQSIKNIENIMNLEFLGKRSMNLYWGKMTEIQQKQFINLFKKIVRKLAYKRCANYFNKNKYQFLKEGIVEQKDFLINRKKKKLKLNKITINVDYKQKTGIIKEKVIFFLYKVDNKLIIFDIEILNGRLIKDYRNQFAKIIKSKGGIEGLIKSMKEKINE